MKLFATVCFIALVSLGLDSLHEQQKRYPCADCPLCYDFSREECLEFDKESCDTLVRLFSLSLYYEPLLTFHRKQQREEQPGVDNRNGNFAFKQFSSSN